MEIKDFQGLTKFKMILPLCYVFGWLCMAFGPVFFDTVYQKICMSVLIYTFMKIIIMVSIMIIITIKSNRIFRRFEQSKTSEHSTAGCQDDARLEINYGFIIPNYNEDIDLLVETLNLLASHQRAQQRYLIFLAMEAHEDGSIGKAKQLMTRFKSQFRVIEYTHHVVAGYEQKGKASNVSWCVQHLQPFFKKYLIDPSTVMLTILDADSWAPDIFFDLMEQHLLKNYQNRHTFIYQPPQIMTRNNLHVPIITRVHDMMHSFAHCSNLFSLFNITFPYSNYSLSYCLAKKIGFWDTCADAIGEDFHTTQKAYWKTGGQITSIPIYAPFNQLNLSTGNGYVQDIVARFWQAERHAQGAADLAWQIKMLLTHKISFHSVMVFYQVLETFLLPAISPWVLISIFLQSTVLYRGVQPSQALMDPIINTLLFNVMSVISVIGYFLYEIFKRRANRLIYRQENQSILRVLQYPILFIVSFFAISVPSFTLATFEALFKNKEYIVSEKKRKINNVSL